MDAAETENLCQEAFLRVVRHRKNYRATARFKTWLFQIALNLCRDRTRRMKHRMHLSLSSRMASGNGNDADLHELIRDPRADPASELETGEVAELVRKAVAALPAVEHLVVVLREYQGMTFPEIAELVKRPVGTLKSLNHSAHTRLRKSLAGYLGD